MKALHPALVHASESFEQKRRDKRVQ